MWPRSNIILISSGVIISGRSKNLAEKNYANSGTTVHLKDSNSAFRDTKSRSQKYRVNDKKTNTFIFTRREQQSEFFLQNLTSASRLTSNEELYNIQVIF